MNNFEKKYDVSIYSDAQRATIHECVVRFNSSGCTVHGDPRHEQWLQKGVIIGGKHDGMEVTRIEGRDWCGEWDNSHEFIGV